MNEAEYFGTAKPMFEAFDLDNALKAMHMHHDIQKAGMARRALAWFTDAKVFERGGKRSQMQADQLLTRILLY